MDDGLSVLRDVSIEWSDGTIVAVEPDSRPGPGVEQFPEHIVLPGLINAHGHLAGTAFRGTEDTTRSFMDVAHFEYCMGPHDVFNFARHAALESVSWGITTTNDIFHWPEATALAAQDVGVRAVVAMKLFDYDLRTLGPGGYVEQSSLAHGLQQRMWNLLAEWQGAELVTPVLGIHAPNTVKADTARDVAAIARDLGIPVHLHLAQSGEEIRRVLEISRSTPVEFLRKCSLLDGDIALLAAHLWLLSADDMATFAEASGYWLHCPAMNARRGFMADAWQLRTVGTEPALGTDWLSYNPWTTMQHAIAMTRVATGDIATMTAADALTMMTRNGARALGVDQDLGSIEVGKKCDLVLLSPSPVPTEPESDLFTTVVYNCDGRDVTDVFVGGRRVIRDSAHAYLDAMDLVSASRQSRAELVRRTAHDDHRLLKVKDPYDFPH